MRQVIIARKDLDMSPGKLAAQVAHASWAFLSNGIRKCLPNAKFDDYEGKYLFKLSLDKNIAEDWFGGIFTKTICEAKNKNQLLKAKEIAEELGMVEGKDFFLIKDACNTELTPEEIDENGIGRTLTCIGFKPLDDETAWKISKKFQLYK
jgi:PTH2 family peptidyl-tRNA hydrolase